MLNTIDNSNVSKHLGKSSQYKSNYDPSLLVKEPRSSNRKHLNVDDTFFRGYDVWNAYEFSCLCLNGTPLTGILKIVYPATNKYIVESKSLKLYLNSFNMQRFEGSVEEIVEHIERIIRRDLSDLLETTVEATIRISGNENTINVPCYYQYNKNYTTLEDIIDVLELKCDVYTESPELLSSFLSDENIPSKSTYYHSSLLKSNCRVTAQPDWGDVFIYYKGRHVITPQTLLQYIVSFRDECHFHEEICETIYKRLMDKFEAEELSVACLYTRRGGIDINPVRVSHKRLLDPCFIDSVVPFVRMPRQ